MKQQKKQKHVSAVSKRAESSHNSRSLCQFAALAMILNQVASIDIGPYVRIDFPESRTALSITCSDQ